MWWRIAARDAVFIGAVVALWRFLAPLSGGDGALADLSGLLIGLGVGVSTFLLHEWGHLLGGLASGSDVRAPKTLTSAYLFSYDTKANSRRQFLVMSFGGFIVTGLAIWLAYAWMPGELLATRVARGAIVFLASLTVFIEFPLVIFSLFRWQSMPSVEVFEPEPPEPERAG